MIKRTQKTLTAYNNRILSQNILSYKIRCLKKFGFIADPKLPLRKNFKKRIHIRQSPLFRQPSNLAFHNLCSNNNIPTGTKQLLGLNLKYCLSTNHLNNNINKTVIRMANSIRTKIYLNSVGHPTDQDYEKQIYVKNKSWHPPPASFLIKNKITDFEKELKKEHTKLLNKYRKINLSNLTPIQANALKLLKKNDNFIIKTTDKNLGPAIMDKAAYIQQVLSEHLLTNTYRNLTASEAKTQMETIKSTLKNLISNHLNHLSKAETTYFQRSLQLRHRLPIFYGIPKVHKSPVTLRPVISSVNSLLTVFSIWLDYKLKNSYLT